MRLLLKIRQWQKSEQSPGKIRLEKTELEKVSAASDTLSYKLILAGINAMTGENLMPEVTAQRFLLGSAA